MSYKDPFCEGFAQGTADADDDEGDADEREADEGIDGPEIEFRGSKGKVQENLDHDDKRAREDGSTAENEEIASADIARERDDRGHDDCRPEGDGKREREKPIAARKFVDEQEIKDCRRKIAGNEDDGVRTRKPRRQKHDDIGKDQTADGVKRPTELTENGDLQNEELDRQHNAAYGDEKQHAAPIDARMGTSVRRIIGRDFLLYEVGMIYRRAAKGTALFGIGKLDTAFDTKHNGIPFCC